jgi:glutamyl-tRNA reductase
MSRPPALLPLAVVGCDFRVASSVWRSRLVLSDEEARTLAGGLRLNQETDGFVDLNTCNRTEWIVSSRDPEWAASLLRSQMIQRAGPGSQRWFSPYVYAGEEGALHLFRVALGQESLVIGERQIAGQLHDALECARARRSSSRILNGLGAAAGRLVRTAFKRGCMAGSSAGVHSLAVSWLTSRLGPGRTARVALVGLGQIGRRVHSLLQQEKRFTVIAFNRTIDDSQVGAVRALGNLPSALNEVDAVVFCTGAPEPVLRARDLAARTADRELVIVDIGVPRQVECSSVPAHVTVCGLDELTALHRSARPQPSNAEGDITRLLDKAVVEFRAFCNQPAFAEIIDSVQRNHGRLVREQIPRVIESRLGYLPDDIRARLGRDLRGIVLSYTSDVFRTIRDASTRRGGETWRDES